QFGNNNAYCQDNETSWLDWSLVMKHADLHRFAKSLITTRRLRDADPKRPGMTLIELIGKGVRGWHGVKLNRPDWSDESHSIALSAELPDRGVCVYLIFNAYWEPLDFELPQANLWRRWIDTSLENPQDITEWREAPLVSGHTYQAGPRSVIVLWAHDSGEE